MLLFLRAKSPTSNDLVVDIRLTMHASLSTVFKYHQKEVKRLGACLKLFIFHHTEFLLTLWRLFTMKRLATSMQTSLTYLCRKNTLSCLPPFRRLT